MKSFLSIKIIILFFFVALTALTVTAKAQTACGATGIVFACSNVACDYFTGNGYTGYMFMHENGTPGTTFKTHETIYHYAPRTTFACTSPNSASPLITSVNLPTGATTLCGPTSVAQFLTCASGSVISKTCQKVGPVQYSMLKVTQFSFATAGTYDCTFNNGNGSTVTLTIDDNYVSSTPYVSITSDVGTTIAPNTSVTYTLSTNIPTTTAVLTWKKNGTTVHTGGTTYTTSTLANNDKVVCQVAFNCGGDGSKSPMSSNTITMTVSVLPVELKSFDGKALQAGNLLTWNTASETQNKGFALERQVPNTKEWQDIMLFVGKNKASTYQYLDETPPYLSYYRLRQIDADGSMTYSKIIAVERSGTLKGFGLSVYPNPVSNTLTLENTEGSDFQIINLLGQQVLSGKTAQRLDVSALPQGSYVLKVGAEQVKFVKQ